MRTCVATVESVCQYVWLSYMQKVLCDAYWDELPDSAVVAMFRARTLRNLWARGLWAMICQLRIHAWLTTAGAIRKEGRPTGIFQRELYYGHAINNGAPRPSDFNFRATISHLNGIPITELPRLSFQRLSWYASAQNQALFVDVSLRDENEYYSWDRVLEGNFTEFFRADELLVAVRLADRNNTTRPTAVPSLNPQFRLGDPHSGSGTCPALTPALAPAVTPVLTPAVTPVLTPVQDQIVAPQEHTIAPSGLDRCSEHK